MVIYVPDCILPYIYTVWFSIVMLIGTITCLKLVKKQAYKIRTSLFFIPLFGSVLIMLWILPPCFIHWISIVYIALTDIVILCTVLITFVSVSLGISVLSSFINYCFGDKIAIWSYHAKPLQKSEVKNLYRTLNRLSKGAGVKTPKLFLIERSTPLIFTVGGTNPTLMVSVGLLEILSKTELDACIGHEISHIKNNDCLIRTLASGLKFATLFNVFNYLIEPAIYREREFLADEGSAKLTGKPKALISALIKISETQSIYPKGNFFNSLMTNFIENPVKGGIFSKHPRIGERIKRLLELEDLYEKARLSNRALQMIDGCVVENEQRTYRERR